MAKCTKTKCKKQKKSIEERAYFKWIDAGMPASDGVEFWLAAEQESQEEPTTESTGVAEEVQ